ncbi:MAG: endonuclease [Leptospiraceae bacterium]|nr:endonuclease [Leptospiraceae bacterium]
MRKGIGAIVALLFYGCVQQEEGELRYKVMGQIQNPACQLHTGLYRNYYEGVNICLSGEAFKAELQKKIKDHRVLPYTKNSGSYPLHFTVEYISLENYSEQVPERFDVWDAYVVFAYKGVNPHSSGSNCPPNRLLDWYDYRCYATPSQILSVSSGGQQDPGTADNLAAPTPLWGQEGVYNREHSWPKDFFEANSASGYCQSKPEITGNTNYYDYRAFTDLHHVIPARKSINQTRGTCAFGIVQTEDSHFPRFSGAKFGSPNVAAMPGYFFNSIPGCSANKVLEPPPEVKGDIARNYFYMATRYYQEDSCWKSNYQFDKANIQTWLENVLRQWHKQDPVSAAEKLRNEWIYRIQGNRNPFVDFPEWVDKIDDF